MKLIKTFQGPKAYVTLWDDEKPFRRFWVDGPGGIDKVFDESIAVALAKHRAGIEKKKETSQL